MSRTASCGHLWSERRLWVPVRDAVDLICQRPEQAAHRGLIGEALLIAGFQDLLFQSHKEPRDRVGFACCECLFHGSILSWYLRKYKLVAHLETAESNRSTMVPMPLAFAFKVAQRATELASNPLEAAFSLAIARFTGGKFSHVECWFEGPITAARCYSAREPHGTSIETIDLSDTSLWELISVATTRDEDLLVKGFCLG